MEMSKSMSTRTIADEARELYDLATLLAMDVAAQHVVNGRGDALTVSRAVTQRDAAKNLLDALSASDLGSIELPERQIDAAGCGAVVDAMLADESSRLNKSMRLANLDAIEGILDEAHASPEFYRALANMRREAEAS